MRLMPVTKAYDSCQESYIVNTVGIWKEKEDYSYFMSGRALFLVM